MYLVVDYGDCQAAQKNILLHTSRKMSQLFRTMTTVTKIIKLVQIDAFCINRLFRLQRKCAI